MSCEGMQNNFQERSCCGFLSEENQTRAHVGKDDKQPNWQGKETQNCSRSHFWGAIFIPLAEKPQFVLDFDSRLCYL